MQKKSQTKASKNNKFILPILVLIFALLVLYLGLEAKNYISSQTEKKVVEIIKQNGFRIEYKSFTTDHPISFKSIEMTDVVLRKIESSLNITTPKLIIIKNSNNYEITLKSFEAAFNMAVIQANQTNEITIKSDEDVNISNFDTIFDFQLPKTAKIRGSNSQIDIEVKFEEQPKLTYTFDKHEDTGDIINRSLNLKPNNIKLFSDSFTSFILIENKNFLINYNNPGFNREFNIDLEQIIYIHDENSQIVADLTSNFNLDLDYKATLNRGVESSVKIHNLKFINKKFNAEISADLQNTNMDIIPTGVIHITLSSINHLLKELHEAIAGDDTSPKFIKSAKFHTIYNMNINEFNTKSYKFASYLNNSDVTQNVFKLDISRAKNSMIMLNNHSLEEALKEFNKIFFGDLNK
jgi:hypothetical protein